MTPQVNLVTVYRSADANAETDATTVRNLLMKSGLNPVLVDDTSAGVVPGTWEVRVPDPEAAYAESIIAGLNQDDPAQVDPSPEFDLITVARTSGTTGEMEATYLKGVLDANGLHAVIVGSSTLPNLSFDVGVPREEVQRAEEAILEARAAGPAAAVEAERETEGQL